MDTALFYPDYLNLTFEEAERRIDDIVDCARLFGGAVTFNWHDRSLAPERLWGEFYASLICGLKQKGAWCSSAGSVVSWFQHRRSVVFERDDQGVEVARSNNDLVSGNDLPGLRLRIYNAGRNCETTIRLDSNSVVTHS
jgi:hypothetical protein